jgi:hypothetical protein
MTVHDGRVVILAGERGTGFVACCNVDDWHRLPPGGCAYAGPTRHTRAAAEADLARHLAEAEQPALFR